MNDKKTEYTIYNPPKTLGDLYPQPYLYAQHLSPAGHTVTIDRVSFDLFPPRPGAHTLPKELCAILHFRNASKALILNKTKSQQLAEALGADFETLAYNELPGKKIRIYPVPGQNGSDTIEIGPVQEEPTQ